jgi:hypothetical protein
MLPGFGKLSDEISLGEGASTTLVPAQVSLFSALII